MGVEDVPSTGQAQGDRVGGAPLVERAGVEEADQHMKLAARADEGAGGSQRVVEGPTRDLPGVVGRLGGRADEAANLPALAPRVSGARVAEVLPHAARARRDRPVVVPVPAGVLVEALGPLSGGEGAVTPGKEQGQPGNR